MDLVKHDGRRAQRVRSKGVVRLDDGRRRSRGRIRDLSTGGIRVAGDPAWGEGEHVDVEISFDAHPEIRYPATGCVRRASADGVAIELDALSPELELQIVGELVAATARDSAPNVILVDAKSPARSAIATAFRGYGWVVTEVSTPLEAIRQIIGDRFDPSVIAIADTVPESVAEQLREFLAGEYPDSHMIAIGSAKAATRDGWIDRDDRDRDLDARVETIIEEHAAHSRPHSQEIPAVKPAAQPDDSEGSRKLRS